MEEMTLAEIVAEINNNQLAPKQYKELLAKEAALKEAVELIRKMVRTGTLCNAGEFLLKHKEKTDD